MNCVCHVCEEGEAMMREQRRQAAGRRVFEAQKQLRRFADAAAGAQWVHPATDKAMKDAELAFSDDDYDRAEHLAAVVTVMLGRDFAKFNADPKVWRSKLRARAAFESQRADLVGQDEFVGD
jgi:hypothetical protein